MWFDLCLDHFTSKEIFHRQRATTDIIPDAEEERKGNNEKYIPYVSLIYLPLILLIFSFSNFFGENIFVNPNSELCSFCCEQCTGFVLQYCRLS